MFAVSLDFVSNTVTYLGFGPELPCVAYNTTALTQSAKLSQYNITFTAYILTHIANIRLIDDENLGMATNAWDAYDCTMFLEPNREFFRCIT